MKKLNKKQKIIGLVAILIVAIILAIVITKNVINKNVVGESYLATTANANSNLVASYIKEGITIGGITGTLASLNTFDATALPEDIIWGETAYVKGEKITGTKIVTVAHGKASQKTFEENTTLIDDYGNRVKVPAGFKIAEDSATSVTGGVVIEDVTAGDSNTKGSQFVWVPVGDVLTDTNGNKTTITLGRYTFDDSTGKEHLQQSSDNYEQNIIIETYFAELVNSNYGNITAKNLADFITKTKNSNGYYIGRYEAGDANAIDERTDLSNDNNPIVCKAGFYPYTYVTQSQAAELVKNMYYNKNFESDLINSYAYDTAIVFIQKFSGDENYSNQRGRNTLVKINKTGESILNNEYLDAGDENRDVRCNIFDMAGNVREFTTEYSSSFGPIVYRGGNFDDITTDTKHRFVNVVSDSYDDVGIRQILYL